MHGLKIKKITPEIIERMQSLQYAELYLSWLEENFDDYQHKNDYRLAIIRNVHTPVQFLLHFYNEEGFNSDELLFSIERGLKQEEDMGVLEKVLEAYLNNDFIKLAISCNPHISDPIVKHVMSKIDKNIMKNLIKNKKLSLDEMIDINEKSLYGLKEVAYQFLEELILAIETPESLEKLMNYTSKDVNYLISKNKYINDSLAYLLSLSNDFRTRANIAQRPDTPMDVLYALLKDESDSVRLALAKNFASDRKILSALAEDSKVTILSEIIKHPKTDLEILKTLKENVTHGIKDEAEKQIERLDNLFVESNQAYYDILESLSCEVYENIIFQSDAEMTREDEIDENRKKILVDLNEVSN